MATANDPREDLMVISFGHCLDASKWAQAADRFSDDGAYILAEYCEEKEQAELDSATLAQLLADDPQP